VTTVVSFSKITFSLHITPIINSFHFLLSFLVFKRAVILVYKENYKLKKKMVSLVSVEGGGCLCMGSYCSVRWTIPVLKGE